MSRDRSRDPPKTADELMSELERDPEYLARIAAKEKERLARVVKDREDAAPVLADLRNAGLEVDSFRALLTTKKLDFRKAIPVLLEWLPRLTNTHVKETIVRTLSVPLAKPMAARPLVEEFRRTDDSAALLRWAIGNALDVVADDSVADEMIELARERRYGKAREMVVSGLGNLRDARAIPVLIELLKDDVVSGHALAGLAKLKPPSARPYIEPMLKHPKAWVRKEAKKVLARIDRVLAKSH
jgi:HEAT repeat protein